MITVWRYKRLIAAICAMVVGITLGVTVMSPKIYQSKAALLAPKEGVAGGVLAGLPTSGFLQQVPGLFLPSLTPNRDMLVSILRSERVAKAVVNRFGLQERYRARYFEDAVGRLRKASDVFVSREGVIFVVVEDPEPTLAAEIANFFVEELDRVVTQLGTGEAGRQRQFVTEQLAKAKADLAIAEERFRMFQEKNRAIALQDQTRGAIEAAARLKGEAMAAEVQLQVMRNFATDANPEIVLLRRRIEELRRQLAQTQYGDETLRLGPVVENDRRDFSVSFRRVPELGIELARLTRDVKVQETLVTLLVQQQEQLKIAEANDVPNVRVLDRAVPAERHSRPRLRLNLLIAGSASLAVGILLTFILDYVIKRRYQRRLAQG